MGGRRARAGDRVRVPRARDELVREGVAKLTARQAFQRTKAELVERLELHTRAPRPAAAAIAAAAIAAAAIAAAASCRPTEEVGDLLVPSQRPREQLWRGLRDAAALSH